MKRVRLEVCPQKRADKPWKVTRDGQLWGGCRTQADGIALARMLADQIVAKGGTVTLKIKRPNGEIRDERTYPRSSDPRKAKG